MLAITIRRERTGHWTRMRRSLARFSTSDASCHTPWLAGCITNTSGFKFSARTVAEFVCNYIRHSRPHGLSVAEGCRLMGLPRSTFYDAPSLKADDAEIIANMITICDEFETYGYRRVGAELRHRGILVNSPPSHA